MGKSARTANRTAASPRSVRAGKRGRAVARAQTGPRNRLIAILAALSAVVIAVGIVVANLHGSRSPVSSPSAPVVGKIAPTGVYSTVQGKLTRLASLRGTPTLVWFVATWCSSCQAGTQTIAQNITRLSSRHVRVVELELAGQQFAGHEYSNPDWIWGVASSQMTQTYDPHAYLDIYYLLNAQGKIVYVNGSPSSTMGSLLQAVGALPA
jgi:thiol-disulfide isomerase/thioredoxin